jgi:hypothetical protein
MKNLYPIKFDFNELYKRKINENEKKFYLSTIIALSNEDDIQWVDEQEQGLTGLYFTIPIYQTNNLDTSYVLVSKFVEWCNITAKICKVDDFLVKSFYISIDISGIKRDNQFGYLFYLISDFIKLAKEKSSVKFFIFLDSLFFENDILFELLKNEVDEKVVFFIDSDGNFTPQIEQNSFKKLKFIEKKRSTQPNYKQQLKNKLVRKLGHFKVKDSDNYCHRYFYDATFCEEEIKLLTKDYIEKFSNSRKQFEYIIYMTKYSPWLVQSMDHLSAELKAIGSPIFQNFKGAYGVDKIIDIIKADYNGGEVLLIADLINSGTSLQTEIENLLTIIPSLKSENLLLLSIMNKKGTGLTDERRKIIALNKEFLIPYFVDVEIKGYETLVNCPLCKLNIPNTNNFVEEQILKFTSYSFWEFSDSAGYEPETYGKEEGKRFKAVTKMTKWFEENSAFVVYKYLKYLEAVGIEPKRGTIFIYPDERYINDEEKNEDLITPSLRLAENLKIFFNAKEIGIPRNIINKYKRPDANLDDLDNINEEWLEILKAKSENNNFVIIDEFHRDGETFESIVRILKKINRNPKCFFPVIDFNPSVTKLHKVKYKDIQYLNLYEFNYT